MKPMKPGNAIKNIMQKIVGSNPTVPPVPPGNNVPNEPPGSNRPKSPDSALKVPPKNPLLKSLEKEKIKKDSNLIEKPQKPYSPHNIK